MCILTDGTTAAAINVFFVSVLKIIPCHLARVCTFTESFYHTVLDGELMFLFNGQMALVLLSSAPKNIMPNTQNETLNSCEMLGLARFLFFHLSCLSVSSFGATQQLFSPLCFCILTHLFLLLHLLIYLFLFFFCLPLIFLSAF